MVIVIGKYLFKEENFLNYSSDEYFLFSSDPICVKFLLLLSSVTVSFFVELPTTIIIGIVGLNCGNVTIEFIDCYSS